MRRNLVALMLLLCAAAIARAHPGTGGCKAVDLGGIKYDPACNVTVQTFVQPVGTAIREINVNAGFDAGRCFTLAPATFTTGFRDLSICPSDYLGLAPIQLDTQVFVKSFTCSWDKGFFWDAGDSVTLCAAACTASSCSCVGSATLVISDALSGTAGVTVTTVNQNTTPTADYGLTIRVTADTDAGSAGGSEMLAVSCSITYEFP